MITTILSVLVIADKVVFRFAIYVPPPGTLTVIMAFLAAVAAMPRISSWLERAWIRYFAVLILCLLAAGEIFVLTHEQHIGEDHFRYVVSRFDQSDRLLAAVQEAETRKAALPPQKPLGQKQNDAALLKRKAIDLSSNILSFLTARQAGEPPLPRRETWAQDVNAETRYTFQTMALYSQQFGRDVIAIHDELAKRGLHDEELDQFYENPTNPIGVRVVAEHLGALAEALK